MEIIRPQTASEKKDFKDINGKDYRNIFEEKLNKFEQDCIKTNKPFCSRCARIDYLDKVKNLAIEMERSNGVVDYGDERFKNLTVDLNAYTDLGKFNLGEVSEIWEARILDGKKIQEHTADYENYKCKVRNCGVTIQVPVGARAKK